MNAFVAATWIVLGGMTVLILSAMAWVEYVTRRDKNKKDEETF